MTVPDEIHGVDAEALCNEARDELVVFVDKA
jgi:hypothetical protein